MNVMKSMARYLMGVYAILGFGLAFLVCLIADAEHPLLISLGFAALGVAVGFLAMRMMRSFMGGDRPT